MEWNGENMKNDRREMPGLENWLDIGTKVGNEKVTEDFRGLWTLGVQEPNWQSSSGARNGENNRLPHSGPNSQVPLPFVCTPASLPGATPISLSEACLQALYPSTWYLKANSTLMGTGRGGGHYIPAPSPSGINLRCVYFEVSPSFSPWD